MKLSVFSRIFSEKLKNRMPSRLSGSTWKQFYQHEVFKKCTRTSSAELEGSFSRFTRRPASVRVMKMHQFWDGYKCDLWVEISRFGKSADVTTRSARSAHQDRPARSLRRSYSLYWHLGQLPRAYGGPERVARPTSRPAKFGDLEIFGFLAAHTTWRPQIRTPCGWADLRKSD